ncbi:hypothetical protein AAUPMC_04861, partial [Pasteurella multocida subsp. multocida str. Anand1_cattle]
LCVGENARKGWLLGGENSGHIIILDKTPLEMALLLP